MHSFISSDSLTAYLNHWGNFKVCWSLNLTEILVPVVHGKALLRWSFFQWPKKAFFFFFLPFEIFSVSTEILGLSYFCKESWLEESADHFGWHEHFTSIESSCQQMWNILSPIYVFRLSWISFISILWFSVCRSFQHSVFYSVYLALFYQIHFQVASYQ